MFINVAARKTNVIVKAGAVVALCIAVLVFSKECTNGALTGLNFCFKVLIPSLFPFMAISSFIVKSGLSNQFGKPFQFVMRKVFGLSRCFAPVILLSMLGGYPVGAKGISSLYKSGAVNEKEAKKAAMFAVCAGPGFLINFVGVSLYKNEKTGFILLFSQILSVLILGIFINLFDKDRNTNNYKSELKISKMPLSSAVVEAAADSSKGILNICAFVILFSAFTGILNAMLSEGLFENCVLVLLEVCSAVDALSKNCPVEFIAFAVGFGGLCVHFQIFSALGEVKVQKLKFFCIRIIQGILTALFTHVGLYFFADAKDVFSTATVTDADTFGGTIISGIALITVAICFLYSLKSCKQH